MERVAFPPTPALNPTCWRNFQFPWGKRTYVVGVINMTPDSFSRDGLGYDLDAAQEKALAFQHDGADIIDVGGESARPGATPISAQEELRRIIPLLERIASLVKVPISIDTYKVEVAEEALKAGASLINDIWGGKVEPPVAQVAAQEGVPIILMHNQRGTQYRDLIPDICASLRESADKAIALGVPPEHIILDPGFGFGKTAEQSLELLRHLPSIRSLGYPVLIGPSRKSTIGLVLNLPVEDRLEGTAATVALGIAVGADLLRVHDVKEIVRVARMSDAIVRGWSPPTQLAPQGTAHYVKEPVTVYLALGSNLGDREANIKQALALIAREATIHRVSSLYETEPWGYTDQPLFLNAACQVSTVLAPYALLNLAKGIEHALGRVPSFPNAPRPIDIDILTYGDQTLNFPDLVVPHPRMTQRAFVLVPLAELAPDLVPPGFAQPIKELVQKAPQRDEVKVYGPPPPIPGGRQ